jgi:4-azaleucine resistance transporter AzlC
MDGSRVWRGVRATLPVALGVMPFGLAYGAVAVTAMHPLQGMLMSLTVFAGTAQFITASMVAQGAAFLPVLITGLFINLRLILLSAAITPKIEAAPRRLRPALALVLTDESFAVSMAEFERGPADPLFALGSGLAIYTAWQVATVAGLTVGANIPGGLGLEYALAGSLICLLFLLVRSLRPALVAVGAAILSLALRPLVGGTWCVMTATLLAATVGVLCSRRRP